MNQTISAHIESKPGVWRHPILLGLIAGWLVGMLWWAGLMIAFFGPSIATTFELVKAPLVAAPWGVVGLMVGAVNWLVRGFWVPAAAALGTVGGGVYSLATSPFDGWLALTMPVSCFAGTIVGLVVGCVCGVASILWAGPSDRD